MSGDSPAQTYRSVSGVIAVAVIAILGAFLLGEAVVRAGWRELLLLGPWVALGVWVVYQASAASFLRVDDGGGTVQNFLRRTSFGWEQVRDIDLRWQIVFELSDGRTLVSYGGPAQARSARRAADGTAAVPRGHRELDGIRRRWQRATGRTEEAGGPVVIAPERHAGAEDRPIRRGWDTAAVIALAVIAVWAVVAVLVAQLG